MPFRVAVVFEPGGRGLSVLGAGVVCALDAVDSCVGWIRGTITRRGRRFGCTRGHGVDVPALGGGRIVDDDCAHGGIRVDPTIDS